MRRNSKNQNTTVQHQLKNFTQIPVASESAPAKKNVSNAKPLDQQYIRRRFSYENRTGAGYQGL